MVENDTHETHWELSWSESDKFLTFLFPDKLLFLKAKGELAENLGHYTMDQIFEKMIQKKMYAELSPNATEETEKGKAKVTEKRKAKAKAKVQGKWLETDFLHPKAPADCEVPLGIFFQQGAPMCQRSMFNSRI